jgi:hypothetical protein
MTSLNEMNTIKKIVLMGTTQSGKVCHFPTHLNLVIKRIGDGNVSCTTKSMLYDICTALKMFQVHEKTDHDSPIKLDKKIISMKNATSLIPNLLTFQPSALVSALSIRLDEHVDKDEEHIHHYREMIQI